MVRLPRDKTTKARVKWCPRRQFSERSAGEKEIWRKELTLGKEKRDEKESFERCSRCKVMTWQNAGPRNENCDECSVKYLHAEDNPSCEASGGPSYSASRQPPQVNAAMQPPESTDGNDEAPNTSLLVASQSDVVTPLASPSVLSQPPTSRLRKLHTS